MCSSAWLRTGAALVATCAVLVMAGCGSTAPDSDHPSYPTPTADDHTPSPAPPAGPLGSVGATATLNCAQHIDTHPPAEDLQVIDGAVALPTPRTFGPLQAGPDGSDDPWFRNYAKQGLVVRTGRTVDLIVPPEGRRRLALSWGNGPARLTWHLHVSCRDPNARWFAFAGGYYVPRPACVSLIVRTGGRQTRVHIAVGVDARSCV